RDLRARAARARAAGRLRRRRRAPARRAGGWRRLPRGLRELLLPPRRGRGLARDRTPARAAVGGMNVLQLGIPKGSLEEATIELFRRSGWKIKTDARSYFPSIDDSGLRCLLVRAQDVAPYGARGTPDAGSTGRYWALRG